MGYTKNARCHFVYGTRENRDGMSGRLLPSVDPKSFVEMYDPLAGYLGLGSDRKKIEELLLNIRPYLSEQPGHNNGAALPEKDPSIDEYGVAEEKTDTQIPLSSESSA